MISPACVAALYLPDEGIIDPMRLACAFAELAARNGVEIIFDSPVTGFEKSGTLLRLPIRRKIRLRPSMWSTVQVCMPMSLAVWLKATSSRCGRERASIGSSTGSSAAVCSILFFQLRRSTPKASDVVPTTRGSVLLGPTVEDGDDRYDKSTSIEVLTSRLGRGEKARARRVVGFGDKNLCCATARLRDAFLRPFRRQGRQPGSRCQQVHWRFDVHWNCRPCARAIAVRRTVGSGSGRADCRIAYLSIPPYRRSDITSAGGYELQANSLCLRCDRCGNPSCARGKGAGTLRRGRLETNWRNRRALSGCDVAMGVTFMCATATGKPPEAVQIRDGSEVGVGTTRS